MAFANYIRVKTFLGCFKLDSGGHFIGAVGLFCAFLQLIAQTVLVISLIFTDEICPQEKNYENAGTFVNQAQKDLQKITSKTQDGLETLTNLDLHCSEINKIPLFLIFCASILMNLISIIAHYKLIKGLEELNIEKFLIPIGYYIFCIVTKLLFFISLIIVTIFVSFRAFLPAIIILIFTIIDMYLFIVIDSIRYKIENSPTTTVTRTPTTTMQARIIDVNNRDVEIPAEVRIPQLYT